MPFRKLIFALLTAALAVPVGACNLGDIVTKGSTSRSVALDIIDSTDGTPETGVVFNTSGIDLWYRREGAVRTAITEATLAALTTAWASGGFLHVSDGAYRLDVPDAAFATSANYVDIGGAVTGMVVICTRVRLVDYSLEDSVRMGLTGLANAVPGAAGGLQIAGSNAATTYSTMTVSGATTLTGNVSMAAGLNITQSSSNTAALVVTGNGTGNGATITSGAGATGTGLAIASGATNGAGATVTGTGTGNGATMTSGGGATGNGLSLVAASTNGNGMSTLGTGTGAGTLHTAGATGSGLSLVGGGTSGNALGTTVTAPIGQVKGFGILESGTLQSATATTAVLRSATNYPDNTLIGATILLTGGTGVGQRCSPTAWTSSSDTATCATWTTTPDNTSTYEVWGTAPGSGSVTIATGGIVAGSFAAGAIDASAIATDAIGAAEIAADAIGTSELATGAITTAEFAAGAIDASAIATDAIGAAEIATDAIGAAEVAASAIGAAELATDAIGSAELADASIDAATFAASAITATVMATDAIGAAELASDATTEIWGLTCAEPAAKAAWNSTTMQGWICWLGGWSRNKVTQTSTTKTLRNDADNADLVTCAFSDNGTTATLSECSP